MGLELPVLSSLVFDNLRKSLDTGDSSDYNETENRSDTIGAAFIPAPPRSPRILGPKAIAHIGIAKRKPLSSRGFLPPPAPKSPDLEDNLKVACRVYTKHGLLGAGGSSMVFKVTNRNQQVFALKQVETYGKDPNLVHTLETEIETLKALRGNDRVVQLFDHEVTPSCITLVMEMGDSDFSQVIRRQTLDNEAIRFYTIEILKCVQSVHQSNIVHSDLKPANFITIKGSLKLIDFGIAGSIPDFTCNVHKKEQIGTISYMAPESFYEHTGLVGFKVGKPSDLWSCGCVIYEMIYGRPPFQRYGRIQMEAIVNPKTPIEFPSAGKNGEDVPLHMIELMQGLLCHDLKKRFTCERALKHLVEDYALVDINFVHDLVKYAFSLGQDYQRVPSDTRVKTITQEVFFHLRKLTMGE